MDTARDRIAAAAGGKRAPVRRIAKGQDGKLHVVEEFALVPVIAGDVVELAGPLGDGGSEVTRALAAGAGAVPPGTIVFQRADQLAELLSLTEGG